MVAHQFMKVFGWVFLAIFTFIFLMILPFVTSTCDTAHDIAEARALAQDPEHTAFTNRLKKAATDFSVQHQTDTIDFNSFSSFAWDSVYVFADYTSGSEMSQDWPWIDWRPMESRWGRVPEDYNRFIFIHDRRAVNYVDISKALVWKAHYFKYFKDHQGNLVPYKSPIRSPHYMPVNCFSRAEAKFILVGGADVLKGDTVERVFATAGFFKDKPAMLKQTIENMALDFHPIKGCGLPNCQANTH